ncbi:hypothetical protein ABHQ57_03885 [Tenacibaculum sp. ZH5_bin.1]|uniref:hypothetical protein n=1 Tax=unclassified Tenacibaculum TaxID=2635139 RepID=UPI0036EBC4AB
MNLILMKLKKFIKKNISLKEKITKELQKCHIRFSERQKINPSFKYKYFIAIVFVLSPFYSLFYYEWYLGQYDVNLFLYLSPEDLILAIYKNIRSLVFIIIIISFSLFSLIGILLNSNRNKYFFIFLILITSFIESLLFYYSLKNEFTFLVLFGALIILTAVKYFSLFKHHLIIYTYIGVVTVFFILKGKQDYKITRAEKLTFDLMSYEKTEEYFMKEKDTTTYWVGSLSKAVFIYDTRIKKVRAISNSRIKEIRYTQVDD